MDTMADAVQLTKAMRRNAVEAVEATKPVNICFGEVVDITPLKINVEQKMILGEKQLVLSRNVTDFKTKVTVDWETESSLTTHSHTLSGNTGDGGDPTHNHSLSGDTGSKSLAHIHAITGKKEITVHNSLVVGDKVILVRQQEGQKFVVLDRIG